MTLLGERIPTWTEWRNATGGTRKEYWALFQPEKLDRWHERKAQQHTTNMLTRRQNDRFQNLFTGITPRELVVDLFCGGGGAGEGIEQGLGRWADIAVNHNPNAISMHTVNHPHTEHFQTDVFDVNPVVVCKGRPVGLLWLSPDCTHFSVARGGKPKSKKIRSLAWVGILWAILVRPRVMMLENVREFRTWGPLEPVLDKHGNPVLDKKNGEPLYNMIDSRKGETFKAFISVLSTGLPADHPAIPEIQEALGEHFDLDTITRGLGYKVEYKDIVAADFGAPTSRLRFFMVARCDGLPITWPNPTHGAPSNPEVLSGKLQPWRTAAEIIDWSIPSHSIFMTPEEVKAERQKDKNFRVNRPLVKNSLMRIAEGIKRYVLDSPEPFIMSYYGQKANHEFRGQNLNDPIKTLTSKLGYAVAMPYLTKIRGDTQSSSSDLRDPTPTIVAGAGTDRPAGSGHALALVNCFVDRQFTNGRPDSIHEPLGTITAEGNGKSALVGFWITKNYTGVVGSALKKPLPTITAVDHNWLTSALITNYNGTEGATGNHQMVSEPLNTVTTTDRFNFVQLHTGKTIRDRREQVRAFAKEYLGLDALVLDYNGQRYEVVDIGMRMFQPHELYAAQGFPADYVINVGADGKPFPKYLQVEMCGNSVCPPVPKALVQANYFEFADAYGKSGD